MPTTYSDPRLVTIETLRAAFPDVTVSARVPMERSLDAETLPLLVVTLDALRGDRHRADSRADVRVLAYAVGDAETFDLARRAEAALLSSAPSAEVRAYLPLSGPVPASDPESGAPLSAFTVEALLRPVTI